MSIADAVTLTVEHSRVVGGCGLTHDNEGSSLDTCSMSVDGMCHFHGGSHDHMCKDALSSMGMSASAATPFNFDWLSKFG